MPSRPYVTIFSTMTVDGRIASSAGFSKLSCEYDLARLRLLRGAHEAVMVGANTVLVDNPTLRKRLRPRTTKYYRIIVDGSLRLSPGLRMFVEQGPPVIVFTAVNNEDRIKKLRDKGVHIHVLPSTEYSVDLRRALELLHSEYGISSVLVEGGGRLNYSLIRERLVDDLRVTITPFIFGSGVSFIDDPLGKGFYNTDLSPRLSLVCMEKCPCGRCVHIVYSVEDRCCPPVLRKRPVEACLSSVLAELIG